MKKTKSNSIVFWVLGIAVIGIAVWFVYTRFIPGSNTDNADTKPIAPHTIFDAGTGKPITDKTKLQAFIDKANPVRGNVILN